MPVAKFIKKHWSNIFILVIIALLFIPQTGMPIKVFFSRLIAFSPSEIAADEQVVLQQYDWKLMTPEGEVVNFATSEEKVVLINFWATWCPPCVAEMPSLQNLFDEYGDRVDFYFVSMESPKKITRFMNKKGYDFPVYIPKQQVPNAIESYSLPTTYVISKQGKIVIDKSGAANWDSETTKELLDELLGH